jgi:hypothetical protein
MAGSFTVGGYAGAAALDGGAGRPSALGGEGAGGPLDHRLVRDHVRGRAGVELADGDDGRVGRVVLAADELLQVQHRLGRRHDRVAAQVWIRPVAAPADERGDEHVGRRQQHAGLGGDRAHRQPGPAVQAEHGRHPGPQPPVEHAALHQPPPTAAALLGRLEHQLHAVRQLARRRLQHRSGSQQRGRVTVVPAGVHHAGVGGGVGQAGVLGDRQRVDVGPQRDARLRWISDPGDGRRRRIGHAGDELDAQAGQLGADQLRRLVLGVAQLGDLVQPVAQVDGGGERGGQVRIGPCHGRRR